MKPSVKNIDFELIKEYKSLLPTKKIKQSEDNHFLFEKEKLPQQVKLLIEVSNPDSINSGSVIFHDEEIFWISSAFKLVLFNPKILTNVIEYDIDYPVQLIFSYNLYLILSHNDSFVTLLSFPSKFSEMFKNDETLNFIYLNKESNLIFKKNPKMLRPIPSSYRITAAQGKFIGCSDGIIRTFEIIGHYPDSNFFVNEAILNGPFHKFQKIFSKKNPIILLNRSKNFLYSLDANNNLTAYLIIEQNEENSQNQITPIGTQSLSKIINMTPFQDSVILTKELGDKFLVTTVLHSNNWYRARKDGIIVSYNNESEIDLEKFNDRSEIYLIDITKKKINDVDCFLWPDSSYKTSGKVVIIYLDYIVIKNDNKPKPFNCEVKEGDIVVFAYKDFKPNPFVNMNNQFISFTGGRGDDTIKVNFKDPKDVLKIKNKKITPIKFSIQEFDNIKQSDDTKNSKSCCLCVFDHYSISNPSLESLFDIPSITHSIWSNIGCLFCIIQSIQPYYGKLITFQYGMEPAANFQEISGRIYGYTSKNESKNEINKFSDIKNDSIESLFIFTSECILKISLNNKSTYFQYVAWNTIEYLLPYWMKEINIKNLSDFYKILTNELKFYKQSNEIKTLIDRAKINVIEYDKSSSEEKNNESEEKESGDEKIFSLYRICTLLSNLDLVKRDIDTFIQNQDLQRQKRHRAQKNTKANMFANSSNNLIPEMTNEQSTNEKDILDFNAKYQECFNAKDIKRMNEFFDIHFTNSSSRNLTRYKAESLSIWIGDSLNQLMPRNSEFLECLINIQMKLMDFVEENFICE